MFNHEHKKHIITLRIIGLIGCLIFMPFLALTFAEPHTVETAGKAFIEWKLQDTAEEKIDQIHIPTSTRLGAFLNKKAGAKIEELKQQLKADLPVILAEQVARLGDYSCECRHQWEQRIADSLHIQIETIETARQKVSDFTQGKYMEITTKLTLDVRIFLATNAVVFLLLLLVSAFKPVAVKHLFLPAILLVLSTIICSYFYIFEQNWFFTILYDDYMGLAYMGYLGVVFAFLLDIAFNKARITTEILNAIGHVIGSAFQLSPC